jgi:hypothetical protein
MIEEEMETKWRRAADELRSMARRELPGPTRDMLLQRAAQLENSAMLRRRLFSLRTYH